MDIQNQPHSFSQQSSEEVLAEIASRRISIEEISPRVDEGKFPAKGIMGQHLRVQATLVMDGHDQLAAQVLWRRAYATDTSAEWQTVRMIALGNDRWECVFLPETAGLYEFAVEAWFDRWSTFHYELQKKQAAGLNTALEVQEGKALARGVALRTGRSRSTIARQFRQLVKKILDSDSATAQELLLSAGMHRLISAFDDHHFLQRSEVLLVDVERTEAGYANWYELFPRSQVRSDEHGTFGHGTFDDVIARLPQIHSMGFNVLYFPPIHPIGLTNRKGRNNSLTAEPTDPGSPYAIGSEDGGHDAVHPELGGIDAFRRLVAAAMDYGIEIALDFAIQCSPDHPWLKEHPEWFSWRPDGSIRYAENPPKKYEDIVPVDFYAEGAQPSLWIALRDVVQGWVDEGVKIFRVDNPHTKPMPFWQWLIADIRSRHPDAIFLAEAFTRPAVMYELGKIGFAQSYTYFTWRNTKAELIEYLQELTEGPPRDFFRPNFFVNTPDINPVFIQTSGRAGFKIRAALATTLSGLWGMYSGFELCEADPIPGKEEYLNSEKYEIKPRDWNAPGNIINLITCLNRIRAENPALHTHLGLRFLESGNDQVLYFMKSTADRSNTILVAISLDPNNPQQAYLEVPFQQLASQQLAGQQLADQQSAGHHNEAEANAIVTRPRVLELEELLRSQTMECSGAWQHWYFDPNELPLAIWRVRAAGGQV